MLERLSDWIVGLARFWYDFVIGDDWLAAAGVLVMLGGAWGLIALGISAWWFGPVAILATATVTIGRALRRSAGGS